MAEQKEGFLDSKTILAIALVGVVWFGWQSYLSKKYPSPPPKNQATTQNPPTVSSDAVQSSTPQLESVSPAAPKTQPARAEKKLPFEAAGFLGEISSRGMGFTSYRLKDHTYRDNQPVKFGLPDEPLFALMDGTQKQLLDFSLRQVSQFVFEGTAEASGAQVFRRIEIFPEKKTFQNTVRVQKTKPEPTVLGITIGEPLAPAGSSSIFMPSYEHQEFVYRAKTAFERINISALKEPFAKEVPGLSMFSLNSQYFAAAFVDQSPVIPSVQLSAPVQVSTPVHGLILYNISSTVDLDFKTFAGPKSHQLLASVDPKLVEVINFGWFQTIGEILLQILKWFHNFLHNWGLSIIALTLLVRLLVMPFNIASYRSMKKMQKVQPLIQSIRDRYKDDSQALNREMMTLFREHKVNPVGGCLPMLLQMPVFFALYQVLGQSVELYKAPFFGWIHDLSLKDPYFILPVLMGGSMWFQQKITPNTMDPAQAKIMQFLPVVFSLFMLALPSGLTLYIFVSTLFGIVQQQLFMREKKASA